MAVVEKARQLPLAAHPDTCPLCPVLAGQRVGAQVPDGIGGYLVAAAVANAIMQLSQLPMTHDTIKNTICGGQTNQYPVPPLRTTLAYFVVALFGTDDERHIGRHEHFHAHWHAPSHHPDPTTRTAIDSDHHRWVTACLHSGMMDLYQRMYGPLTAESRADFYQYGRRSVPQEALREMGWPPTYAAFEDYWDAALREVRIDEPSRSQLTRLTTPDFLPYPARAHLSRRHRFLTTGFLPPHLRTQLDLPWTPRDQAVFGYCLKATTATEQLAARWLCLIPQGLYSWVHRRRTRAA